jgi:peptide methionine sulfoxide reductase MsrB
MTRSCFIFVAATAAARPPTSLRYCINGVAMNFKPE